MKSKSHADTQRGPAERCFEHRRTGDDGVVRDAASLARHCANYSETRKALKINGHLSVQKNDKLGCGWAGSGRPKIPKGVCEAEDGRLLRSLRQGSIQGSPCLLRHTLLFIASVIVGHSRSPDVLARACF